jgi:hypothetical protein
MKLEPFTGTHTLTKVIILKYMLLAQLLLIPWAVFAGNKPAFCELGKQGIVSRSSDGVAQVSNLGEIKITCRVPARTFLTKPAEIQNGLTAATMVYEVSPNGSERLVPSDVQLRGAGRAADEEFVEFFLHVPLDPAARDAEARRYLAKIQNSMPDQQLSEDARRGVMERLRPLVYQHRVGRFHVKCRVLDGKRILGMGNVQFEVLFKGRFSDVGLSAAPPA